MSGWLLVMEFQEVMENSWNFFVTWKSHEKVMEFQWFAKVMEYLKLVMENMEKPGISAF